MPTISSFYGIIIYMYWDDHAPPHFHATYAEHVVQIELTTGSVIKGYLPPIALAMVRRWAKIHRMELEEDWLLCGVKKSPRRIPALP
ncbi:MAG: DUF4160 domain-containing protein [Pseudomonadota bacterium]